MRICYVLIIFFFLSCQNKKLDLANEVDVTFSSAYFTLDSGNIRYDSMCVNNEGEVFLIVNSNSTGAITFTEESGQSYSQISGQSFYLQKLNSALQRDKTLFYTTASSSSTSKMRDCTFVNENIYIIGEMVGNYGINFGVGGTQILSYDRSLNFIHSLQPVGAYDENNITQGLVYHRNHFRYGVSIRDSSLPIVSPSYYSDQAHMYLAETNLEGETYFPFVFSSDEGIYTNLGAILYHQGRSYVSMYFSGNQVFAGNQKISLPDLSNNTEIRNIIVALDANYQVLWSKLLLKEDGLGPGASVRQSILLEDGLLFLIDSGDFQLGDQSFSHVGSGDIFIFKLGFDGKTKWVKQFGHTNAELSDSRAMDIDEDGNIYYFYTFSNPILTPSELEGISEIGSRNGMLVKMTTDGDILNYAIVRTDSVLRAPVLKYKNKSIYVFTQFRDYIEVGNRRIDFNGEERAYTLRFDL